ncbi:MAG: hypothetical protein L3J69_07565 [Desulfobacula sp.]|nr:hypothetical protein [Desulfobacula sp.]
MTKISLKIRKSNWETIAFLLIYDFLKTTGKYFVRSELMRMENIDKAVNWLKHLNHKKHPEHPEETLQRTIQNLRDKGYIIFHGQGEYELTQPGIKECKRVARELNVQVSDIDETIQVVKNDYKVETIEKAKEIMKQLTPEQMKSVLQKVNNSK